MLLREESTAQVCEPEMLRELGGRRLGYRVICTWSTAAVDGCFEGRIYRGAHDGDAVLVNLYRPAAGGHWGACFLCERSRQFEGCGSACSRLARACERRCCRTTWCRRPIGSGSAYTLTATGKLDRRTLPAPGATAVAQQAYTAPVGKTETIVAQLYGELLGVQRVGRYDSFFERAGTQLLAIRLVARLSLRTWS